MRDARGYTSFRRMHTWTNGFFNTPIISTFIPDLSGGYSMVIGFFAFYQPTGGTPGVDFSNDDSLAQITAGQSGDVEYRLIWFGGDRTTTVRVTPQTDCQGMAALIFETRPGLYRLVADSNDTGATSIEVALPLSDTFLPTQRASFMYVARTAVDAIVPGNSDFSSWSVDNGSVQATVLYADAPMLRPFSASFAVCDVAAAAHDLLVVAPAVYPPAAVLARR